MAPSNKSCLWMHSAGWIIIFNSSVVSENIQCHKIMGNLFIKCVLLIFFINQMQVGSEFFSIFQNSLSLFFLKSLHEDVIL